MVTLFITIELKTLEKLLTSVFEPTMQFLKEVFSDSVADSQIKHLSST